MIDTVIGLVRDGGDTNMAIARSILEDVHVSLPPRPDVVEAAAADLPQQSPRLTAVPSPGALTRQGSGVDRTAGAWRRVMIAVEGVAAR